MTTTQLQATINWWNKKGSFNMEHFERVLKAKEGKQAYRFINNNNTVIRDSGRFIRLHKLLLIVFVMLSSCRVITTYHYEDRIDGTTRTVKDNGETQQSAYWVKVHRKNIKRVDFILLQKEKVYLPQGMNIIINDSLYVSGKHKYHRMTYVNGKDTATTYFLIHEKSWKN